MSVKYLFISILVFFTGYSGQVSAQSPTATAGRFNIFVKGNATLTTNETEGPVAIGGNLTSGQYQVSFENKNGVFFVKNASIGLAVRGGVKLNSGSLTINGQNYLKIGNCTPSSSDATNLKVWYKDNNNAESNIRITGATAGYGDTPNININANANTWSPKAGSGSSENAVCENVFGTGSGQIDIDGAFQTMITKSGQLATLTDNLPIRDQNGKIMPNAPMGPYLDPTVIGNNPKIIVDPTKLNVLTVSAAVWEAIKNSNVEGMPSGATLGQKTYDGAFGLVVNIIDFPAFASKKGNSTINFPSFGGISDSQGSFIIYNFPDAKETVTVAGNAQIVGTIFTPQANLIKANSGNINGQVIAQSFIHNGDEVHFWPFLTSIPDPKKLTVVAESKCSNNAPLLDYTVTPNYTVSGDVVKIEWLNSDGAVVKEQNNMPLSGSILFPGAAIDKDGKGTAWPGYAYQDGKWVQVSDLNSTIRNAGAKIRVTITPTQTISISYPASTGSCFTSPPPPPVTPLPVTLSSFTARNENCNVQVKWTVTDAKNFSHFVVQRSTDARTFVAVNKVSYDASIKDYGFTDSPFSGETVPSRYYYYRLQQVDTDGSIEYSAIRSVDAGTCENRLALDFYPNPVQTELNVKSFSPLKMMEIYAANGQRVFQSSALSDRTEVKVDVQGYAQGLYIVKIVNGEGSYTSKILKK
jgi:choice-of-anchor A domain-containing protein